MFVLSLLEFNLFLVHLLVVFRHDGIYVMDAIVNRYVVLAYSLVRCDEYAERNGLYIELVEY